MNNGKAKLISFERGLPHCYAFHVAGNYEWRDIYQVWRTRVQGRTWWEPWIWAPNNWPFLDCEECAAEPRPRKEYLPHDAFHFIVLAVVGVFACWHWGKLRNMSALTKPRSLPLYNQDPTVSKFPLCIINQPNFLLLHLTCDTGLVFVLCDFYLYKIKIHSRNTFVATTKKKIRRMIG
jgi:hypothetical protein